jgi:integrase/recombinase XerD
MSLPAVQKILGHDRLTTTDIYLNLTDGHVLDEIEAKW